MNQDKQSFSTNKQLLFVYNAESSLFNQIGDLIHKIVSPKTYGCNLCSLTYSGARMNSDWKEFINSLPIKPEFLHKDEFLKQYPDKKDTTFPIAFMKEDSFLAELISTQEINQQRSLDDLKKLVKEKTTQS